MPVWEMLRNPRGPLARAAFWSRHASSVRAAAQRIRAHRGAPNPPLAPAAHRRTGLTCLNDGASFGAHADHREGENRKSTRLNSSHVRISYAVFCLKKKN